MFESKKASGTTEHDLPKEEKAPEAAPRRGKPLAQPTIIPADVKITGDLVSTGDIHVEGAIYGNITCRALTLSGQPVIKGSLKAETVRIYGTFDGNVQAKKVALTKDARMKGNISYGTLEIEPGAKFEGKVSRLKGT
jgi:cytoskeletal protein CcmA (bactofilin family)